jgi:hypothetical protein
MLRVHVRLRIAAVALLAAGCTKERITRPEIRGIVTDVPARCAALAGSDRVDCIYKNISKMPPDGDDAPVAGVIVEACSGTDEELPSLTLTTAWACPRRGLAAGHPIHPTTSADGRFVIPPYVERTWREPSGLRTIVIACNGDFPFRFGATTWSPGDAQPVRVVLFPENNVPYWNAEIEFAESRCAGIRHLYEIHM